MEYELPPHPEHTFQWSPREKRVLTSHFEQAIEPLQKRIAELEAQLASGQGPLHQFRAPHCADWYDGHPDPYDGKKYETRALYTHPAPIGISQADCLWARNGNTPCTSSPAQQSLSDEQIEGLFVAYSDQFDCESDEWQDMGANAYFMAGYKAAHGIKEKP